MAVVNLWMTESFTKKGSILDQLSIHLVQPRAEQVSRFRPFDTPTQQIIERNTPLAPYRSICILVFLLFPEIPIEQEERLVSILAIEWFPYTIGKLPLRLCNFLHLLWKVITHSGTPASLAQVWAPLLASQWMEVSFSTSISGGTTSGLSDCNFFSAPCNTWLILALGITKPS